MWTFLCRWGVFWGIYSKSSVLTFGADDSWASHTGLSILQNEPPCFLILQIILSWYKVAHNLSPLAQKKHTQSEVNECDTKDLHLLLRKIRGILPLTLEYITSSREQGKVLFLCYEILDSVKQTKQQPNKLLLFFIHCHNFSDVYKNQNLFQKVFFTPLVFIRNLV